MLRRFMLLLLLACAALIVLPFLLSSYYIDQHGITIPGKVSFKREDVIMRQSRPTVESEVSIEYAKPDGSGVTYMKLIESPNYDAFHIGQPVSLHYLRPEDVPHVPLAVGLRKMHFLPTVRLAGDRMFSDVGRQRNVKDSLLPLAVLAAAALLLLWRIIRLPGLIWIALCCFAALGLISVYVDFPQPTPEPNGNILQTNATVKSLDKIPKLFQTTHSSGVIADMPIEVVGLQFTPQGFSDPVVTVDLVNAGSNAGLHENALVPVYYQADQPRIAHIQDASRDFVSRNLNGIVLQGVYVLVVCGALLLIAYFMRRGYQRLTSSSSSRTN